MTEFPKTVLVETKSAWLSKINWTQAVALLAMALSFFGFPEMSSETQAEILAGIIAIQAFVTWVFKTFLTSTVTPSSAAAAKKL